MESQRNRSEVYVDLFALVDRILHLVTPYSNRKPLCGESSPAAAIGAYCEHLDEKGEWCREVFGKSGKTGRLVMLALLFIRLCYGGVFIDPTTL